MEVLLSGLVGALIVFILGWGREWWRDKRRRETERRGILLLLSLELQHNAWIVDRIDKQPVEKMHYADAMAEIKTDTWEAVRVRLAQLLSKQEVDFIAQCYVALYGLRLIKMRSIEYRELGEFEEAYRTQTTHFRTYKEKHTDAIVKRYVPEREEAPVVT